MHCLTNQRQEFLRPFPNPPRSERAVSTVFAFNSSERLLTPFLFIKLSAATQFKALATRPFIAYFQGPAHAGRNFVTETLRWRSHPGPWSCSLHSKHSGNAKKLCKGALLRRREVILGAAAARAPVSRDMASSPRRLSDRLWPAVTGVKTNLLERFSFCSSWVRWRTGSNATIPLFPILFPRFFPCKCSPINVCVLFSALFNK